MAIFLFNEVSQLVQEGLCLGHWNNVLHTHCLRDGGGEKRSNKNIAVLTDLYGLSSRTHIPFYILELVKINRLETVSYIQRSASTWKLCQNVHFDDNLCQNLHQNTIGKKIELLNI